MTESETARLLAVIALAYPTFEVTRERIALWQDMLRAVEFDLAQRATRRHIAESKWAPTVAEIMEAARETAYGPQMDAGDVWHQLISAVRRYGNYRLDEAREALPAAVMQAIDYLGGWREVCMCENEDVMRAHFLRMWETIVAREKRAELEQLVSGEAPPALPTAKPSRLRSIDGGKS